MSKSQYMTALAHANEIRLDRARVKHQVARGEITIAEALDESCCVKMTVFELLCARRRHGPRTTLPLLLDLRISQRREIGKLTPRQRSLLVQACEPRTVAA